MGIWEGEKGREPNLWQYVHTIAPLNILTTGTQGTLCCGIIAQTKARRQRRIKHIVVMLKLKSRHILPVSGFVSPFGGF